MILRRFIASVALFLSGCAGAQSGYPSLAKRPIESAPVAEVAPDVPATIAPDAQLDAEIVKLTRQAQNGRTAFDRSYGDADRLSRAASGAAVSSEAWVAAQLAISNLEAARNDSVSALASLDVLYVERVKAMSEGTAGGGTQAIDTARSDVLAIVDAQNDRVDGLKARLRQP